MATFYYENGALEQCYRSGAAIIDISDEHGGKDEDMERKKATQTEPGADFYERAYVDTIIYCIAGATSKQTWWHLTGGWLVAKHVKAAYLVPKSLSRRGLAYLFGAEELTCRDNRPAKRYLYFRFISLIIHAQKSGNVEVLNRLDVKACWALLGKYLRRLTLRTIARQISSFELAPAAYEDMTIV
ncbi:uncharacterized protein TRUGW13939_00809 [Talaromyces rugulosus]|uniref:Uncharacterized protein n=1 Tax=Talaromyces rugulosus TaxID=121627 RepID=A0A7H8QIB3_TALRU|nr:uncharacterized protein TRUGW13939_00809 [Talaromyces rugulosus]QKX53729.1 hypothetical protein TRUGW13939_00809 [Talaromyces rugulosus]